MNEIPEPTSSSMLGLNRIVCLHCGSCPGLPGCCDLRALISAGDDMRDQLRKYVWWCAREGTPPRLFEFARLLNCSPVELSRAFRRRHGLRPKEALAQEVLTLAEILVEDRGQLVSRIAVMPVWGTSRSFYRLRQNATRERITD